MAKLEDGTIMRPHRGKPPPCPEGYEPKKGDPFICFPILESCEWRETRVRKTRCCTRETPWCQQLDAWSTRGICRECKASLDWILENKSRLLEERKRK